MTKCILLKLFGQRLLHALFRTRMGLGSNMGNCKLPWLNYLSCCLVFEWLMVRALHHLDNFSLPQTFAYDFCISFFAACFFFLAGWQYWVFHRCGKKSKFVLGDWAWCWIQLGELPTYLAVPFGPIKKIQ